MKSIVKTISVLIFLTGFSGSTFAQSDFALDTVYLPDVDIKKITSYNGYQKWFVCNNEEQNIYMINENSELIDMTNQFALPRQHSISDIINIGTNQLLVSTRGDYVYLYDNGNFIHIDENHGLAIEDSVINYLTFSDAPYNYYHVKNFGIAANKTLYVSDTLSNLLPFLDFYEAPDNLEDLKLLNKNFGYLFSYHTAKGTEIRLRAARANYGLLGYDDISNQTITCGNVALYDNGNPTFYEIGTENGFYGNSFSGNSNWLLKGHKINAIVGINDWNYIVAADNGLYYGANVASCPKIELAEGNFVANDVITRGNSIYAATDSGLFCIKYIDCSNYEVKFKQNKKYLSIEQKDTITFNIENYSSDDSFSWDFGDGFTTTEHFPAHFYNTQGNYKINLITTNNYCFDTLSTYVTVYNSPEQFTTHFTNYKKAPFDSLSTLTGTINLIDADGDNDLDVFIPYAGLFENCDSSDFYLRPTGFNVEESINSIWGDLNNDGLNDLIVKNTIYQNLGNFKFREIKIDFNSDYSDIKELMDVDANGYLDIIGNTGYPTNNVIILYNMGNFKFVQDENNYDITNDYQFIKATDIDGDNNFDLLISGKNGTSVYKNNNGVFVLSSYPGISGIHTKDGPVGDIDNDLFPEYYTYDVSKVYLFNNNGNSLSNRTDTWITNEVQGNTSYPITFSDADFSDLDNNGYLDCLRLSGFEFNSAFMNLGDYIFIQDTTNPIHTAKYFSYRSIASADLTGNGFPEIVIGQGYGYDPYTKYPNYLFLNNGGSNNYIKIKCLGSKSNFNAIGTTVKLKASINGKKQWQIRQITSKSTSFTQNGYELLFGIDQSEFADSIVIEWPLGSSTVLTNMQANKYYKIIEPVIRTNGDTIRCNHNIPLQLRVAYDKNTKYQWYKNGKLLANDTLNLILPDSSGYYSCEILNPYYKLNTTKIHVIINPVSQAKSWFANADSTFCDGDSVMIFAKKYEKATYHWYVNNSPSKTDTLGLFYANKIGNFYHILENKFGCLDTSNIVIPIINYKPDIELNTVINFCEGDSVSISIPGNYINYQWSNGDSVSHTTFYNQGYEQIQLTDSALCTWNFPFNLKKYDFPKISLGPDTSIFNNETIVLNNECNNDYTYYWYDGDSDCSKVFGSTNLKPGKNIIYLEVNNNGCYSSDTINIYYNQKTSEGLNLTDKNSTISVYPVPAKKELKIKFNNSNESLSDTRIEILNTSGNIVKEIILNRNNTLVNINISSLIPGTYILRIMGNAKSLYHCTFFIIP